MSYIRTKTIKGNKYQYEQSSQRIDGKVKTTHVRYIGKGGGTSSFQKTSESTGNSALKEELKDNEAKIEGNSVILYHHTSQENKQKILRSGEMFGKEDGIFFTTKKEGQASEFGEAVIKFKVPIYKVQLDDAFGDEAHVRIPTKKSGQIVNMKNYIIS